MSVKAISEGGKGSMFHHTTIEISDLRCDVSVKAEK